MMPAVAVAHTAVYATVLRTGGTGPHALSLTVATDTLPGTSAARYDVPAAAPVVVRYTLVNTSEASILNLHVYDPDIPSSAISCAGGTDLLPPLATRECAATVPAADGRRVRTVTAAGALAYFGTPVSASASTGYVGYQAALTVHELVAGASTDPSNPDSLPAGSPVQISYQITNTGDVPLSALTLRSSLAASACPAISSSHELPPGARVVCTFASNAASGLHIDDVVATAAPQLTVLSDTGGLAAAPSIEARDQGAYLGLAPTAANGAAAGRGRESALSAEPGPRGARLPGNGTSNGIGPGTGHGNGPGSGSGSASGSGAGVGGGTGSGSGNATGTGTGTGTPSSTSDSVRRQSSVALNGAGFPKLMKRFHSSLPWLMMIFLVVFVPVVVHLARGNKSSGR